MLAFFKKMLTILLCSFAICSNNMFARVFEELFENAMLPHIFLVKKGLNLKKLERDKNKNSENVFF
jgi:hypothetical protein